MTVADVRKGKLPLGFFVGSGLVRISALASWQVSFSSLSPAVLRPLRVQFRVFTAGVSIFMEWSARLASQCTVCNCMLEFAREYWASAFVRQMLLRMALSAQCVGETRTLFVPKEKLFGLWVRVTHAMAIA